MKPGVFRRRFFALPLVALLSAIAGPLGLQAGEYGDVTLERQAKGIDDVPLAVFPHWVHRMQFKCAACHDELFKMKAGSAAITMAAIQDRRWCGRCHDGKAAFESNFDTCSRCHRR